jgi:glutathione S-transferase
LAEKKMDVELIEERYWEQSTEFLRRNPAGQGSLSFDTKARC